MMKWDDRHYDSPEAAEAEGKRTGRICAACVFCVSAGVKTYTQHNVTYDRRCTHDPDEPYHFVKPEFHCKAFAWADGKAPRAKTYRRKITL